MRLRMRATLSDAITAPIDPESRPLNERDAAALARLMLDAYRGSVDDEGEGPDEAKAEIDRLFAGAYGPFNGGASEVTAREGRIVAATLVTEHDGVALIAFSMTSPEWKRRGLARAGLLRTMERLRRAGRREVWLAVTATNEPARRLYEFIGFEEVPH